MNTAKWQQLASIAYGRYRAAYEAAGGGGNGRLMARDAVLNAFPVDPETGKAYRADVMARAIASMAASVDAADRFNRSQTGMIKGINQLPCLDRNLGTDVQLTSGQLRYEVQVGIQIGNRQTTRTMVVTSTSPLSKSELDLAARPAVEESIQRIRGSPGLPGSLQADIRPMENDVGQLVLTVTAFWRC